MTVRPPMRSRVNSSGELPRSNPSNGSPRRSPRSLYRTDFATFEADTVYRQRDAEGFINLNALRLKIRSLRDRRA